MSNEHALEMPLDQLRAAFHHHNLCRKEAGVKDDDVLLDRIKEMNSEISRLREAIIANSATYESERFALKSEIEELREALKKIAEPYDTMWPGTNITRDAIKRIAKEALAAHAPIAGEKPV